MRTTITDSQQANLSNRETVRLQTGSGRTLPERLDKSLIAGGLAKRIEPRIRL